MTAKAYFENAKDERELCAKCGFTYYNHIGNLGNIYPCWTPAGRYSTDKNTNQPVSPSGEVLFRDNTRVIGKEIAEALNRGEDPTGQRRARQNIPTGSHKHVKWRYISKGDFTKYESPYHECHCGARLYDNGNSCQGGSGYNHVMYDMEQSMRKLDREISQKKFPFTADDVAMLKSVADYCNNRYTQRALDNLSDRIQSLLNTIGDWKYIGGGVSVQDIPVDQIKFSDKNLPPLCTCGFDYDQPITHMEWCPKHGSKNPLEDENV